MTVILAVIGVLFAAGIALALYRVVRGPTILDRMIGSDLVLTSVVLILGADMVVRDSTETLPVLLAVAATASFATIAVARYVTKRAKDAGSTTPGGADADAELVAGGAGTSSVGADGDAAAEADGGRS